MMPPRLGLKTGGIAVVSKRGRTEFHSGRHDRDGGPSRRRREEQVDWRAPPTRQADWVEEAHEAPSGCETHLWFAEAQAGH